MSCPDRTPDARLPIWEALALGALHGPAELLPISSSGHVALVPWLLSMRYVELDDELRKSFEIVVHAGTAAALLITLRDEVSGAVRDLNTRRLALIALSFIPPAIVGYGLERQIERHLGTPGTIAGGLLAGSVVMAWADRAPQERHHDQAGAADALWLGVAQASALIPGVSRNGATLAAARLRGFAREDANRLSRHVALPVIAGATLLKGIRLRRRGLPPGTAVPLAAGAAAAFASTLGSTWLIRQVERDRSLLPYAIYRSALAMVVLAKLRTDLSTNPRSARSTTMRR
jgi:undecaprenyl-diphosphatase